VTVHHLRPQADEDRELTPVERALVKVRLAAFSALEAGASRHDVDQEIAEAARVFLRMRA
jgi:hypothetical protein